MVTRLIQQINDATTVKKQDGTTDTKKLSPDQEKNLYHLLTLMFDNPHAPHPALKANIPYQHNELIVNLNTLIREHATNTITAEAIAKPILEDNPAKDDSQIRGVFVMHKDYLLENTLNKLLKSLEELTPKPRNPALKKMVKPTFISNNIQSHVGLENPGNNCWANSCLQLLAQYGKQSSIFADFVRTYTCEQEDPLSKKNQLYQGFQSHF